MNAMLQRHAQHSLAHRSTLAAAAPAPSGVPNPISLTPLPIREGGRGVGSGLATRARARLALCLLLATLLLPALPSHADYLFSVPSMEMRVVPQPDASVVLSYTVAFQNDPGGEPLAIVDIGLPHSGYDLGNMKASLDGAPLTDIRKSTEVSIGVEVHLTNPLAPGKKGEFRFSCTMPDLVYQDSTNKDNASLRITPTWWGSAYVRGTTDLWVIVELPLNVKPEQVLYQLNQPFKNKGVSKSNTFVAWEFKDTAVTGEHLVGLSFPKGDWKVIKSTPWGLAWKWWQESPGARTLWAIVMFVLLGIFFFRLTRGTGCVLYVILLVILAIAWAASPALAALGFPVLLVVWILVGRSQAARKRSYLPAIASTPGAGIKRGLTVPEAAVIMEVPLGRVLTLVIFGMLKKGLLTQVQAQPLMVQPGAPYAGDREARREAAKAAGSVIRGYEQEFLDALAAAPGKPVEEVDFKKPMKELINGTVARMAGFDVDQTREYYKSIMSKAWADAKQIGDLNMRSQFVDDNLLWMMMAPDYGDQFGYWHHHGYNYYPRWTSTPAPTGAGLPTPGPVAVGGRTSLSDVGASFAGWAENLSGKVAGSVDPVSLGIVGKSGLDLSGVDHVTGDILKSMSSGSGGGGGGGGGCACAGCACACACAGGGR